MRARAGDERDDLRRLFDTAYRPLLAYALRRTESLANAEDVVAETLLVAWRRRAELPERDDAVCWLYGVARRVIANQRRGQLRRRRLERLLAPVTRAERDPGDTAQVRDETRAVLGAARQLSEADQEILRLAAWEGLSQRELAAVLGCTENAAGLRLHHARRRLRRELVKRGAFPGHEVVEVAR